MKNTTTEFRDTLLGTLRKEFPRHRFDVRREINDFMMRWRVWVEGRPMRAIIDAEAVQNLRAFHGDEAEAIVLQTLIDSVREELHRDRWHVRWLRKIRESIR